MLVVSLIHLFISGEHQTWTSVSRVDDSEPHQLLHSETGYWISGLAG